ncbi:hypothetical protein [Streptomyces sp. NBC_01803]|uniref:hypothetical protein n=1 Tax=Streptomyces sp. NBC_01803 TaxID=2975946 RepID=UPI002DD87FAB|nr:hypothetical protein [Streptomyces sp. NBC_01803]WSA47800.1 hypothetical protein OIE51_19540 [Streptomyces sp. NBC_01803]
MERNGTRRPLGIKLRLTSGAELRHAITGQTHPGEHYDEPEQPVVRGLFPTLQADWATLNATDAWIASHEDRPPALRRLVLESRDDLASALRAQERDG